MLNHQWQQLSHFKPGGQQAELFLNKLQRQTGWNRKFCRKAIDEYKRFIFLTTIASTPLSPSVIVDEVWHLHLTFSRCYWQDLCKNILGFELHHDPAPAKDKKQTQLQYFETLQLYKQYFNEEAPQLFWPRQILQLATRKHQAVIHSLFLFTLLFGLTMLASANATESKGGTTAWFVIGIICYILFCFWFSKNKTRRKKSGLHCTGGNCGSIGSHTDANHCGPGEGDASCGGCGGGGCGGS